MSNQKKLEEADESKDFSETWSFTILLILSVKLLKGCLQPHYACYWVEANNINNILVFIKN